MNRRIFLFIIIILMVLWFCFAFFKPFQKESDDNDFHTSIPVSQSVVERAKRAVTAVLKDPESAKFGYIYPSAAMINVACGTVNAKNSFGGYTGEQKFIANPSTGSVILDDGKATFESEWQKYCSGSKPKILIN